MWFGRSIADRLSGVDCIPLYAVKFLLKFGLCQVNVSKIIGQKAVNQKFAAFYILEVGY